MRRVTDHWAKVLEDPSVSEVGGEHNNEGVDYARYLAMALIVDEERKKSADYAVVFEYLQDLMILDSPTAPKSALLIQVKKKTSGIWTKSELLRRKKVAAPDTQLATDAAAPIKRAPTLSAHSPLGKLYYSVRALSSAAKTSGLFASNAGFDLKNPDGSRVAPHKRTLMSDLHTDEAGHVSSKLTKELKLLTTPELTQLSVEQCKVIPGAMRATVRGMLAEFLSEQYGSLPDISGRLQESLLEAFSERSGVKTGLNVLRPTEY